MGSVHCEWGRSCTQQFSVHIDSAHIDWGICIQIWLEGWGGGRVHLYGEREKEREPSCSQVAGHKGNRCHQSWHWTLVPLSPVEDRLAIKMQSSLSTASTSELFQTHAIRQCEYLQHELCLDAVSCSLTMGKLVRSQCHCTQMKEEASLWGELVESNLHMGTNLWSLLKRSFLALFACQSSIPSIIVARDL